MIIEYKDKNMTPFCELDIGEIFSYEGYAYLVTGGCHIGSGEYNAINLVTCEFCTFGSLVKVRVYPHAKLILED